MDSPLVSGFVDLVLGAVVGFFGTYLLGPALGLSGEWLIGTLWGMTGICAALGAFAMVRS